MIYLKLNKQRMHTRSVDWATNSCSISVITNFPAKPQG